MHNQAENEKKVAFHRRGSLLRRRNRPTAAANQQSKHAASNYSQFPLLLLHFYVHFLFFFSFFATHLLLQWTNSEEAREWERGKDVLVLRTAGIINLRSSLLLLQLLFTKYINIWKVWVFALVWKLSENLEHHYFFLKLCVWSILPSRSCAREAPSSLVWVLWTVFFFVSHLLLFPLLMFVSSLSLFVQFSFSNYIIFCYFLCAAIHPFTDNDWMWMESNLLSAAICHWPSWPSLSFHCYQELGNCWRMRIVWCSFNSAQFEQQ